MPAINLDWPHRCQYLEGRYTSLYHGFPSFFFLNSRQNGGILTLYLCVYLFNCLINVPKGSATLSC